MSKHLILALFGVCVLLLPGAHAGAQAPPGPAGAAPPVPTITANVREVLVPVLVTDEKGRPVSDLQQADFTVFEDGVPQRIVAFGKKYSDAFNLQALAANGNGRGAAPPAPSVRSNPNSPPRTYLICVDTIHSSFGDVEQARRALTKFFQNEHDPEAQYALLALGRGIKVIQNSTRDPSAILSALASKKFQGSVVDSKASSLAFESEQLRRMLAGFSPGGCGPGNDAQTIMNSCANMKRRVRMFIDKSADHTATLTRAFVQELTAIVKAEAGMPTERTLILISDGFNLLPGEELYGIASAYFPNDPEWRFNKRDAQPLLDDLLRLAQKDNVVVDALDSRGVYAPVSDGLGDPSHEGDAYSSSGGAMPQMMRNEQTIAWQNGSAMAQLASATGGIYYHNNNRLLPGLQRAFDDERVRYLLAYSPSNETADGKYRKIAVKVKGKKLRVYAKAGYWAPGGQF